MKTRIFTADNPTKMYIALARNGTDPNIKLTRLKFSNPRSPQFNIPGCPPVRDERYRPLRDWTRHDIRPAENRRTTRGVLARHKDHERTG